MESKVNEVWKGLRMKRVKKYGRMIIFPLMLVLIMSVFLAGCGNSGESEGESIYKDKCLTCHGESNIENSTAESVEDWQNVVTTMVGYGMDMSEEDQAKVVEYLANR